MAKKKQPHQCVYLWPQRTTSHFQIFWRSQDPLFINSDRFHLTSPSAGGDHLKFRGFKGFGVLRCWLLRCLYFIQFASLCESFPLGPSSALSFYRFKGWWYVKPPSGWLYGFSCFKRSKSSHERWISMCSSGFENLNQISQSQQWPDLFLSYYGWAFTTGCLEFKYPHKAQNV